MSENIFDRRWARKTDVLEVSSSWNAVWLFCLLGLVLTAAALISASDETIVSVTAALSLM